MAAAKADALGIAGMNGVAMDRDENMTEPRYCANCECELEGDDGEYCQECEYEGQSDMNDEYSDPDSEYYLIDGVGFADPGGNSALRAATPNNPRIYPCPTCGEPNRLTRIDKERGYQCDECADRAERGW